MSTSRQASFGSAKPLPGQSGYKESQTALLEREAAEMENRLKMLQERMQQQNEADEKAKSSTGGGGTRWGGASKKKGSVTSYARDVQERHKKQSSRDPAQRATAAARRSQRQAQAQSQAQGDSQKGFSNKDVDSWTVADVGDWLTSMLLQQHIQSFAANAISGAILLEVSLEDLDYMEVTVLAHRKIILKGIEDLRKNKRVTKQLFAPETSLQKQKAAPMSSRDDGKVGRVTPEKEKGLLSDREKVPAKAHWSTLEPLRMKEVPDDDGTGAGSIVNGADSGSGGGGMLDEEAERRAFQEAVMSWRQGSSKMEPGGKSLLISTDTGGEGGAGGQWSNPFGGGGVKSSVTAAVGMDDDEQEQDMVLVSARSHHSPQQHQGSSLADGLLDEEKERREFQAAVAAWRSGDEQPPPSRQANKAVAARLAEQMDAQHQESSLKLRQDQDNMLRKIQKAREDLDRAKSELQQSTAASTLEIEEHDDSLDVIVGYDSPSYSHYYGGEECLSPCTSLHEEDDEGGGQSHAVSYVEVELIQSTVLGGQHQHASGQVEYSVDEPSSDDDEAK